MPASLSIPVTEKLTRDNFRLWRAQVLPAIRSAQLESYIDGTEKAPPKTIPAEKDSTQTMVNPEYVTWTVRDQHVLTYLVNSLSREVLAGVASHTTAASMWAAISKSYASQSRSRILHLWNQLAATRKDDKSVVVYYSTLRGFADEMATAGKPLDDDDFVSHVLNGLDADYNPLIEQINGMTESIDLDDLYSRLLDTEARLALQRTQKEQFQILANSVARGRGGSNRGGRGHGDSSRGGSTPTPNNRGSSSGRGQQSGGRGGNPNNPYRNHQCQICKKYGHTALRCWNRFDNNFHGPEKEADAATTSYSIDPAWYADMRPPIISQ